ncbi:ubl carboxyl-terminal hydrolase 18 [Chiloscyllium plagiosum]|uniref:ubl carboxyl-terminal hydrolase 18 n=1 Tax=Chiloscyllium plagiosum TaxID=36176 RepID=UPI001CB81B30|nr:ubl carboxyl-terminal hydrolase 18 [Chiloscyllium plagiosum]
MKVKVKERERERAQSPAEQKWIRSRTEGVTVADRANPMRIFRRVFVGRECNDNEEIPRSKRKDSTGSTRLVDVGMCSTQDASGKKAKSQQSVANSPDEPIARCLDMEEGPSQLKSPWPYSCGKFKNGLVGLSNGGLTCCVNVLLQSFYLTPEFTSTLQRWEQMEKNVNLRNVPYHMCRLFDQMQTSKSGQVSAEMFLHCLKLNHVKVHTQNDAAELFLIIFNLLLDHLQTSAIVEEMKRLYEIKVEQLVQCSCGEVTVKDSRFWSLPVPVIETQCGKDFTLEDGLTQFFSPQSVRSNSRCPNHDCKMKHSVQKSFKLISVPEVLNLHLNRFCALSVRHGFTTKMYNSVTFPQTLNLKLFPVSERSQTCGNGQESWNYQLYAVLVHIGSALFGHYIAYVKSFKDSMWYKLDDSSVSRANWMDVTSTFGGHGSMWSETAYVLLYRRMKTDDTKPSSGAQTVGL